MHTPLGHARKINVSALVLIYHKGMGVEGRSVIEGEIEGVRDRGRERGNK